MSRSTGHLLTHSRRYERARQIETMNPGRDYEAMYRLTAMVELPWEHRFGWNLAYYRPFAVPRMANLLKHTGQMQDHTVKRAHDTGLMMYELFEHGLGHPRARAVIRKLNRMHREWDISQDDYRYILTSFAVVPTRFIESFGWRPLSRVEREAAFRFYQAVGERMGIKSIPASYDGMSEYLDAYEEREACPSPNGQHLTDLTLPFLAARLPRPIRSRAPEIAGEFFNPRMRQALGLPKPRRSTRMGLRSALAARRALVRRQSPPEASWFVPGMANAAYPEGYDLSDLGPSGK